jgi:hypothetical protein
MGLIQELGYWWLALPAPEISPCASKRRHTCTLVVYPHPSLRRMANVGTFWLQMNCHPGVTWCQQSAPIAKQLKISTN